MTQEIIVTLRKCPHCQQERPVSAGRFKAHLVRGGGKTCRGSFLKAPLFRSIQTRMPGGLK